MPAVVLDASAVLAVLQGEPGAETVEAVLGDALISAVNYSEVVSKLYDRGVPAEVIDTVMASLALVIEPFDRDQAVEAGSLRNATRALGLSLGDRACLALAKVRGAPAITMDRAWRDLKIGVTVECLRPA